MSYFVRFGGLRRRSLNTSANTNPHPDANARTLTHTCGSGFSDAYLVHSGAQRFTAVDRGGQCHAGLLERE
jgi:hypothetical protein